MEIKHVDLPQEMQRAMARQAEAERERRSKIIAAGGGSSRRRTRLAEAADIMGRHPMSLQLRLSANPFRGGGGEQFRRSSSRCPIDLIKPLMEMVEGVSPSGNGAPPATNGDGEALPAGDETALIGGQEAGVREVERVRYEQCDQGLLLAEIKQMVQSRLFAEAAGEQPELRRGQCQTPWPSISPL